MPKFIDHCEHHRAERRVAGLVTEPFWPSMADYKKRPNRVVKKIAARHGAKTHAGGRFLKRQMRPGPVAITIDVHISTQ